MSGVLADKATRLVAPDEPIELVGPPPRYVGRGGDKLGAALDRFDLDVEGMRCLDAGSSTGGFTDALLAAGAVSVIAVDVGRNQLHERLRADDRVEVREQTDIRAVGVDSVGGPIGVVVADLSFISITRVAAALVGLLDPDGHLIVLVKPQFEASRVEVSKGRGVIRDPAVWHESLAVSLSALRQAGAVIMDAMVSPLRGADGNVEFLVHARAGSAGASERAPEFDVGALVASVEGDGPW